MTVPTRDSSGHAPPEAAASEHNGTPASFAAKPAGSVAVNPDSSCSPSSREKENTSGVYAPACASLEPAVKLGANPPPHPETTSNGEAKLNGAPSLHGVNEMSVVKDPQLSGVASAARGPPSRLSFNEENGNCGVSANVVVNWPVCGSDSTCPASLITAPSACAYKYSASVEPNGF